MHWRAVDVMNAFRQLAALAEMNLRNLPRRFWPSLVIVVGMASVIGVLLSMLSLSTGLNRSFVDAGRPDRAIILSNGAEAELGSNLSRDTARSIADSPGIKKDLDGKPIASAEILNIVPATKNGDDTESLIFMRGIGPKGLALRPEIKLIAGRMFVAGKREMIVGLAARTQFSGLDLGGHVRLPDGDWAIVGVFETGGDIIEGELVTDTDTVLPTLRRNSYASVIARLESPDSFDRLKQVLTTNPALSISVERHSDYYAHVAKPLTDFLALISYLIGGIMAVGALFGALNTMYSAVSARSVEIATLRAIGFGSGPVALSILGETLFLALLGAVLGSALAWGAFDGNLHSLGTNMFHLAVTPDLLLVAFGWTCLIALLGGVFPAVRAARLPVATALRAK
jgi:putative ABC transport system permease protein